MGEQREDRLSDKCGPWIFTTAPYKYIHCCGVGGGGRLIHSRACQFTQSVTVGETNSLADRIGYTPFFTGIRIESSLTRNQFRISYI
jgi:hypothetical protein